jgi:hypothetical protein
LARGLGRDGLAYRRYLHRVASALQGLAPRAGMEVANLPARVGRPRSTPAKIVDEYLWAGITREFRTLVASCYMEEAYSVWRRGSDG